MPIPDPTKDSRGKKPALPERMDRRWYDKEPACSRLVKHMQDIQQPSARIFCAQVLMQLAEKVRKATNDQQENSRIGLNSLGVSAIANRYHYGQEKRRWYDEVALIHKAVASLYMLPPEGLTAVGFKLGDTFGLIRLYAIVCEQVDQEPGTVEMTKICSTALQAGKKEASDMLVSIVGSELLESLSMQYNPDWQNRSH